MVKRLTEIYKSEDGQYFESEKAAKAHEEVEYLVRTLNAAMRRQEDKYGLRREPTIRDIAEALIRAGFRCEKPEWQRF